LGGLISDSGSDENEASVNVYIHDELGVLDAVKEAVDERELDWHLEETDVAEADVEEELDSAEDTAYIFLDDKNLKEGTVPVYTSEEIPEFFMNQVHVLETPVKQVQLNQLGF